VLRGIRNGAIYGVKIRAPHAFVMTMLFRSGSWKSKLLEILTATYTHSKNLAMFVGIYKALVCLLRHLRQEESGINAFLAGCIGGVLIFGDYNPVNSQINMYLLSRIIMGAIRTAINRGWISEYKYAYQLYAAFCWGVVMYLFHFEKGTLQPSLISSMTYLYLDPPSSSLSSTRHGAMLQPHPRHTSAQPPPLQ